ncbi:hypothetical protein M231_03994 [Tremella mesenterica]|uniref:Xylanolytic transcriptional activator regulatory domain-containing protein n=1 Tax=Tremella mesenterica TaxID=5217 RepID=A0A4Q1BLN0_TREME|nr:hypothetical protein M231_03994 [Tremella mesenterica]
MTSQGHARLTSSSPFSQFAQIASTSYERTNTSPSPFRPLEPPATTSTISPPGSGQLRPPPAQYLPSNAQLLDTFPTGHELTNIISEPHHVSEGEDIPRNAVNREVLPSRDEINGLLRHFEFYTLAAFPIFYLPTLERQVQEVCFGGNDCGPVDICMVFLVLAVAATSIPRSSPLIHLKPQADVFHKMVLPHMDVALRAPDVRRLQVKLIHLQYVLYNPSAGNVWELAGGAIRIAVDLALHRESQHRRRNERSPVEQDLRRRLFWTAYCIDRNLTIALGRPLSLPDAWINTIFPMTCHDTAFDHNSGTEAPLAPSKLSAIHHFQVRILQSEIYHRLYTPNSPRPPHEWFDEMSKRITTWRETAPCETGFCSTQWLNLNYHMSTIILNRPSPANPDPDEEGLKRALKAASGVMRTYKEMYRAGRINFNWLSMYQLFMAGVTYLNSIWQAHRKGYSIVPSYVDALLDVQVCTAVMEPLAAITPGTTGLRDAFEHVSESIIRRITSRATWASRPPSPIPHLPTLDSSLNSSSMSQPAQTFEEAAEMDTGDSNPLDQFFFDPLEFMFDPLGDLTTGDWHQAFQTVGPEPFGGGLPSIDP